MDDILKFEFIKKALLSFEENSINYGVLRNYEDLKKNDLKDLDILIEKKHVNKVVEIFNTTFNNYIKILYVSHNQQRAVISILFNDNSIFFIDLNKYITLKTNNFKLKKKGLGVKLMISDFKKIKYDSDKNGFSFSVISPEQEVILLLNHLLIKKKPQYVEKINSYLTKHNHLLLANSNDNDQIFNTINLLLPQSKIKRAFKNRFRSIFVLYYFIYYKILLLKKSKVVYFSGPDGSGKSTTYLYTMETFEKMKIKYFPLRSMQVGMQYYSYARKKKKEKKEDENVLSNVGRLGYSDLKRDRDNGKLSWKLRRFIGLFVGLIDICIIGRFFIYSKKLRGYNVIVEESPIDIYVKRHRPQIKVLEKLFLPLIYNPHLSILCVASEENIYERKPELKVDEITEYYDRINDLYNQKRKCKKIDLPTDTNIKVTISLLSKLMNKLLN